MIVKEALYHPSINERMRKVHERMYLEKISGISASNKDAFLAFCREQEAAGLVGSTQAKSLEKECDSNAMTWSTFDDWNNSPVFSFDRQK
jgi:hypothetical protein